MKEFDLAESNTIQAKKYFESISDSANLGLCYQNLAKIKFTQKQYKEAVQLDRKALELFETIGDTLGIITLQSNLGIATSFVDETVESDKLLKKSLELAIQYDVVDIERNSLHQLSINRMNEGDFVASERYLDQAEAVITKNNLFEFEEALWQTRADLFAKSGQYKKYTNAVERLKEVKDVHFQRKNQQIFEEMLVLHEHEKIRAKNKLLEADVSLQRTKIQSLIVILIGALVAFIIIFILYLRVQKQMKVLYRNAIEFAATPTVVGIDLTANLEKELTLDEEKLKENVDELHVESNEKEKFKELFIHITSLLESKKPYLNPGFSKSELVQQLATNEKYIYQAIHHFSGKNFN